jgi:hypothetical protein
MARGGGACFLPVKYWRCKVVETRYGNKSVPAIGSLHVGIIRASLVCACVRVRVFLFAVVYVLVTQIDVTND